jgi:hypothetical protein
VVEGTGADAVHPLHKNALEPRDLRLVLEDGVRLLVLARLVVKRLRNGGKARRCDCVKRVQSFDVVRAEACVALEFFEEGLGRHERAKGVIG